MRFAKGRLELPVEQRRRDAQIAVVDSGGLAARGGDDRRRTTPKRHATTASRGLYQISSWLDARVGVIHPLAPLKLRWDSCTGFALVRAGDNATLIGMCLQDIVALLSEKQSPRENDPSETQPKRRRRDRAREVFAGRGVPLVGSGAGAHALPHHHALPALLRAVQQRPLLAHRVPEPRHGHVLPRGLFDYLPDGHRRPGRRRREPLRHREDRRPAASFESFRPGTRRAIVTDALGRPRPTSRASRPSTCWRACPSRTSSCSSSTTRTGPRAARARSRGF